MFMALDSAVYGNSLFGCPSVPPPALFKATDLLQSNLTGRNNPKDNHIPQSVVKCTTASERWRKKQKSGLPQGCCSLIGGWTTPWPWHPSALTPAWSKPKHFVSSLTAARLEAGCNEARNVARVLENWVFLPALCWGQERATLETIAERDLKKARRNLKVLLWCLVRV